MIVVGLTGGIATGKSTVGRILRELGVPVIDADVVARDVVAPGSKALTAIVSSFGDDILTAEGSLDRKKLRSLISKAPSARERLNEIMHPPIRQEISTRLAGLERQGCTAAAVEAALLVETGGYRSYPELIVVTCSPELQLQRLMARDGMDRSAAERLISTQLPLNKKESYATWVIRNETTTEALSKQVEAGWRARFNVPS